MAKIIDRFLLLLLSLAGIIALIFMLLGAFGLITRTQTDTFISQVYNDVGTAVPFIVCCIVLLLIAIRMFAISIRTGEGRIPSIDQRTEYGDIRISMDTVENLALKAAGRSRGVRDLKARVRVDNPGLEIELRAIVDGDTSIPVLTEEIQSAVKEHVEEITGIPVASVAVYIANIVQNTHTFKSRVE